MSQTIQEIEKRFLEVSGLNLNLSVFPLKFTAESQVETDKIKGEVVKMKKFEIKEVVKTMLLFENLEEKSNFIFSLQHAIEEGKALINGVPEANDKLLTLLSKSKKYPFIIHASPDKHMKCCDCGCNDSGTFPTHTHGLSLLKMPELFINSLSFGSSGNGYCINEAYEFCVKPKNKKLLQDVLKGEIIKQENMFGDYTICFREVPSSFEGVKSAYPNSISSETRYVQIWVDGDDFALEDDYYKNGEKK